MWTPEFGVRLGQEPSEKIAALKGMALTRHCFGLPHLFLTTEATQDLKVKSTQKLTVPKP